MTNESDYKTLKIWRNQETEIKLEKDKKEWNEKIYKVYFKRNFKNKEITERREYATRNAATNQIRKWIKEYKL